MFAYGMAASTDAPLLWGSFYGCHCMKAACHNKLGPLSAETNLLLHRSKKWEAEGSNKNSN